MNTHQSRTQLDCPGGPSAIESVYSLGHWLIGEERYADAAVVFRVMMRAAPTDERGWLALGACHENLDQRDVALELFEAGCAAAEPSIRCQLARFRTLWDLDRFQEADEAIEIARELSDMAGDDALIAMVEKERRERP